MLLIDNGLRISELVNLKMDDVHMDEEYLKVMGKGKKERIVPFGSNAQRALQRYLFRFRPAFLLQVDTLSVMDLSVRPKTLAVGFISLIYSDRSITRDLSSGTVRSLPPFPLWTMTTFCLIWISPPSVCEYSYDG